MTNPMQQTTSQWVVESTLQSIEVDEKGVGEATFTVTNAGPTQRRVVFEVVPGDGAAEEWFVAIDPQRLVSAGGSVTYQVQVRVPDGTAAGSYDFAGRAYSADQPPEETSATSNRIKLEIKPKATRPARKINPLLLIAAGLVLLLIVLGVGGFFLFRGGNDGADEIILDNSALVINPNNNADLDAATVVRANGTVRFNNLANISFLQPLGTAKIAHLGVVADPNFETCAEVQFQDVFIPTSALRAGSVLCVETGQQRMAVITVQAAAAQQLSIQYDLFRHKSAG